jgi:hypothetical protein
MENSDQKNEDLYRFYFIMGMVLIAMGNVVLAVIDKPFGLFGLGLTIAGLIFLLITLRNREKWVGKPETEN